MKIRSTLLIAGMLVLSLTSAGQLRLPPFDIGVKTGYLIMPDDYNTNNNGGHVSNNYESVWMQGELNFHLGQRIAIGGFLNRSLKGIYLNKDSDQPGQDAEHQMYGVQVRFSTGRSAKVRPYVQLRYFTLETVVHGPGYDIAAKRNGGMICLGLMLRLSNKLYLNLPELQLGSLINMNDDAVLFRDETILLKAGAGITYNFSRRK